MRKITSIPDELSSSLNKLHGIKYWLGSMLCIIGISLTITAAPSNLDPTFGVLGKVFANPDGAEGVPGNGMALQADGKIVMVGNKIVSGAYAGMVVARYNADGSLDTTFGINGWASVVFGSQREMAVSVDIQPDGKIVIGGTIGNVVDNLLRNDLAVARFNSDGSLDTTFSGDGKLTIDYNDVLSVFYQEYFGVIKVRSDGMIMVAGVALDPAVADRFIFARINTDGTLDTTFGTNGKFIDGTSSSNSDRINDMLILPDGKFVVAGKILSIGGNWRMAVKFSANGGREWTYMQGVQSQVSGDHEGLNGIAALPDGKFIVVGKRVDKTALQRINADGTEDSSFTSPGLSSGEALSVAVQADGKIVATLRGNNFSLVRFNANGSLDTTFGVGGFVSTRVSSGFDSANKVLILSNGKILVGGSSAYDSPTKYSFSLARYMGESTPQSNPLYDYDGDGRADISVFRPSDNKWYIIQSSNSVVVQKIFAIAGDIPAPADYDGDGKTDVAIFRPSSGDWWYQSSINNAQVNLHWGQSGDIPRPSDFDGDRKADFIVYRPSNGAWYRLGSTGAISILAFGTTNDKPLVGDFDGDGKSDPAIFRPSTGDWWYSASASGGQAAVVHWGQTGDVPAPADYDADGKTDFVIYRPSNGGWYILRSSDQSYTSQQFGLAEDRPVPADYDGDGKADVAVFRPSSGTWYLLQTTSGFGAAQWGASGDIPTENSFLP